MFLADPQWQQGAWGGGPCFLIALLVIGGLVAGGWAIWRRKGPGKGPDDTGSDDTGAKRSAAEETLADRYARGDLSEEEYWEKLSVVREAQSR